eukprot:Gb_35175 [translate_table: standard]
MGVHPKVFPDHMHTPIGIPIRRYGSLCVSIYGHNLGGSKECPHELRRCLHRVLPGDQTSAPYFSLSEVVSQNLENEAVSWPKMSQHQTPQHRLDKHPSQGASSTIERVRSIKRSEGIDSTSLGRDGIFTLPISVIINSCMRLEMETWGKDPCLGMSGWKVKVNIPPHLCMYQVLIQESALLGLELGRVTLRNPFSSTPGGADKPMWITSDGYKNDTEEVKHTHLLKDAITKMRPPPYLLMQIKSKPARLAHFFEMDLALQNGWREPCLLLLGSPFEGDSHIIIMRAGEALECKELYQSHSFPPTLFHPFQVRGPREEYPNPTTDEWDEQNRESTGCSSTSRDS